MHGDGTMKNWGVALVVGVKWWVALASRLFDHGQWQFYHGVCCILCIVSCVKKVWREKRNRWLAFCHQAMVMCWLNCQWGVMVDGIASIEFCYIVGCILAFSNRGFWWKNKRSIGMLAFILLTGDAGCTWCGLDVFQGNEGVIISSSSNCHGVVALYWNFYEVSCRLRYHMGGMVENYLLSKLSKIYHAVLVCSLCCCLSLPHLLFLILLLLLLICCHGHCL